MILMRQTTETSPTVNRVLLKQSRSPSRVCAVCGSFSATDGERVFQNEDTQPTNAAHFPGAFRSALVLQIEAKIFHFFFCKTTNPLNIKMSKEIFFFLLYSLY